MKSFVVAAVVACLVPLSVVPARAAKFISGVIASNTTLNTTGGRVYQVTSSITVNPGVTLTIDPGVVLKFSLGTSLTVNGKIFAPGGATPDSLIYFTSIRDDNAPAPAGEDTNGDGGTTTPASQNWVYVRFTANSDDTSLLKYCVLRYGGSGNTGMILCEHASPTINRCDLAASYYGIRCNGVSNPIIRNTSINAMADVPVAIEIQADPVFDNLAFGSTQNNGFNALGLLGGTLTGANTLRIRGATLGATPISNLVYILISDFTVNAGGSLTIQPGVVVKPKAGVNVLVQGTLTMNGTANPDSQIVFTSFKDDTYGNPNDTNNDGSVSAPARGDWGQIEFQTGSTGSVSRAILKFGGSNTSEGVIRCMNVSPPISNCTISDANYGIEQKGTASSAVTNVVINNCAKTPIYMSVAANPTFSGLTFSNNALTALGIINEAIATNSVLKVRNVAGFNNITYWLSGTLTMNVGARLRVEPGVVVKAASSVNIIINGALSADARPESLIVFTSQYDDVYGNPADTEGNGGATVPGPSNWGYINFAAISNDPQCILDYCVLAYGGYDPSGSYHGVVWCNGASPTISHCQFKTNFVGIGTDGNSAPVISNNDFFNHSSVPLATSVVSNPQYSGNTFNQNTYHAVGIIPETLSQNATLERIFVGGPPQFTDYFPYVHLGALTIGSGAKLTIEAGVIVKVLSGTPLVVNGGLDMLGQNNPTGFVIYTSIHDDSKGGDSNVNGSSTSPAAGNWNGIQFNTTATASLIEWSHFRFGGSGNGIIRMASASPTIRNCEFEINTWGLWIQNVSNPVVQNNLFRLTTYLPVSASINANPTFSGNVYDNNGYDALGLIGETIGQNVTITKRNLAGYTNITRILVGTLAVNFGVTLTIDPGVVLKMGRSSDPFGNLITVDGAIAANGTVSEPITFTSTVDDAYGNPLDTNNDGALTTPTAGDWQYIDFRDVSTDLSNVFKYCRFRYSGLTGYAARTVTAGPTFQNCTFYRTGTYAIRMEGASNPKVEACTFDYSSIAPVQMSLISNPNFVGANVFNPTNTYRAIGIIGETLAQDVRWKRRSVGTISSVPYVLTGSLTAGLSSILRVQPGVVIKPLAGVTITVKRGFIAEGKAEPESLIVFTSPRDDFYGGDTNNDSTLTDGSSLRWGDIQVDNEAVDDSTRFRYCVFRYAGNSSTVGSVNVTNAHPEFDRCIFQNNGIGVNFNGAAGDSTKGKIERCDFLDNTFYGVKNTGLSFVVSAKHCWWGHASGPLDNSNDTGSGGWYNPTGLGDPVTNLVDYSDWKTGGVQNLLLGDVSLNGEVRAFDASLALQYLALLTSLTTQQQTVGDVNCTNVLSTLDASYILRYVAGILSYFPCAFTGAPGENPAPLLTTENLYLPGSEPGFFDVEVPAFVLEAGAETVVPIEVSGEGELLGHEYHLDFDPSVVTIADVRLTKAAAGAMLYWKADADGHLHIAAASMDLLPVSAAVELVLRPMEGIRDGTRVALAFTKVRLNEQDLTDIAVSSGGTVHAPRELPGQFALMQNRPNPFNPTTTIEYAIPASAVSVDVNVSVYDVAGRLIRTLVERAEAPGFHSVLWDGRDTRGVSVGSGVYFYRIAAGSFRADRKMVLLK